MNPIQMMAGSQETTNLLTFMGSIIVDAAGWQRLPRYSADQDIFMKT
jgi:hypothetical protein